MDPARPLADILTDLRRGIAVEGNFELLYRRFHGQVYRFLVRRGASHEESRDLTQEVFFAVYRGVGTLQNENQFPSWLFTIARNVSINAAVKTKARKREGTRVFPEAEGDRAGSGMDVYPAPATSPVEELIEREKHDRLLAALADLSPQMRRCVQMRVCSECSYEEIGLALRISVNTVKAHLHQARKNLKEKLGADFSEVEVT